MMVSPYWVNYQKRLEMGMFWWAGFKTRPYEMLTILCWRWLANARGLLGKLSRTV
jgi:hypothetical protein